METKIEVQINYNDGSCYISLLELNLNDLNHFYIKYYPDKDYTVLSDLFEEFSSKEEYNDFQNKNGDDDLPHISLSTTRHYIEQNLLLNGMFVYLDEETCLNINKRIIYDYLSENNIKNYYWNSYSNIVFGFYDEDVEKDLINKNIIVERRNNNMFGFFPDLKIYELYFDRIEEVKNYFNL